MQDSSVRQALPCHLRTGCLHVNAHLLLTFSLLRTTQHVSINLERRWPAHDRRGRQLARL